VYKAALDLKLRAERGKEGEGEGFRAGLRKRRGRRLKLRHEVRQQVER